MLKKILSSRFLSLNSPRSKSSYSVDIFGSCVTRDSMRCIPDLMVDKFHARQSIISVTSKVPENSFIESVLIKVPEGKFLHRVIKADIEKDTLPILFNSTADIVIIDLIEERFKIGITPCGAYVSLSTSALQYSNILSKVSRVIDPFSDEYIRLFSDSIQRFTSALLGKTVIIHRAFYIEDRKKNKKKNSVLKILYNMLDQAMPGSIPLNVYPKFVVGSSTHIWGPAPYHYDDGYYRNFAYHLSHIVDFHIDIDPNATLQKPKNPPEKDD